MSGLELSAATGRYYLILNNLIFKVLVRNLSVQYRELLKTKGVWLNSLFNKFLKGFPLKLTIEYMVLHIIIWRNLLWLTMDQ